MGILLFPFQSDDYSLSFFRDINSILKKSYFLKLWLLVRREAALSPRLFLRASCTLGANKSHASSKCPAASIHSSARPAIQLMNASVSSNYLSPCFVPTQIFVATIAFLLPGAEHSPVEADKKVCVGKGGDVKWPRSKSPWSVALGSFLLQRNFFHCGRCPLCVYFFLFSFFFCCHSHLLLTVPWKNRSSLVL